VEGGGLQAHYTCRFSCAEVTPRRKKSFVDPSDAVIFVSTSCAEEREDRRVSRAREVLGIMALPEVVEGMWVS